MVREIRKLYRKIVRIVHGVEDNWISSMPIQIFAPLRRNGLCSVLFYSLNSIKDGSKKSYK